MTTSNAEAGFTSAPEQVHRVNRIEGSPPFSYRIDLHQDTANQHRLDRRPSRADTREEL